MPLFTAEGHARAAAGEFTVTYRLWKTPHVTAGKTYPSGFGGAYVVEDVTIVKAGDVTDRQARAAGCANAEALLSLVGSHTKAKVTKATKLYRVKFHYTPEVPARGPSLDVDG